MPTWYLHLPNFHCFFLSPLYKHVGNHCYSYVTMLPPLIVSLYIKEEKNNNNHSPFWVQKALNGLSPGYHLKLISYHSPPLIHSRYTDCSKHVPSLGSLHLLFSQPAFLFSQIYACFHSLSSLRFSFIFSYQMVVIAYYRR